MADSHWSLKKYAKKVKSTDITIKRKSIEQTTTIKKIKREVLKEKEINNNEEIIRTPKKICTPNRSINIVTPGMLVKIKGSPKTKRYSSARKIEF